VAAAYEYQLLLPWYQHHDPPCFEPSAARRPDHRPRGVSVL